MIVDIKIENFNFSKKKLREVKIKKLFGEIEEDKFEIKLKENMIGEIDYGNLNKNLVSLKNASHLCIKIIFKENNFYCRIKVLETPMGKSLKSLLESIPTESFRMEENYDPIKDEIINFNVVVKKLNWSS